MESTMDLYQLGSNVRWWIDVLWASVMLALWLLIGTSLEDLEGHVEAQLITWDDDEIAQATSMFWWSPGSQERFREKAALHTRRTSKLRELRGE